MRAAAGLPAKPVVNIDLLPVCIATLITRAAMREPFRIMFLLQTELDGVLKRTSMLQMRRKGLDVRRFRLSGLGDLLG